MPPTPAPAVSGAPVSYESDRRLRQRYFVALDVEYKFSDESHLSCRRYGRTINISSGGILVETQNRLTIGRPIELSIQWPCLLSGSVPLKLVVRGDIVRNDANFIAVRITWHQFRTAGIAKASSAA